MWFYIPATILIVLLAWWISRTKLFRHLRRGTRPEEGQPYQSSKHWEGDGGTSGYGVG